LGCLMLDTDGVLGLVLTKWLPKVERKKQCRTTGIVVSYRVEADWIGCMRNDVLL